MDKNINNKLRVFDHTIDIEPQSDLFRSHDHNAYELYLFISGNVDYVVEGVPYKMKPFSFILTKPLELHRVKINSLDTYERYVIHFVNSCVPTSILEHFEGSNAYYEIDPSSFIVKTMRHLSMVKKKLSDEDYDFVLQNAIINILIELKYLQSNDNEYVTKNPTAQKIVEFIKTNIEKPLNIKIIASELYLSPSYVSHLFQNCFNISAMNYIKKKKIVYADSLMQSGISPMEAASVCGFNDYSTFYRQYKKTFGKAPSNREQIIF